MVATFWVIFINLTVSFFVWFSVQSGIGVHSSRFVVKPHGRCGCTLRRFYLISSTGFKDNFLRRTRMDTKLGKKAEPEPRITRMAPMFGKLLNARMPNAEGNDEVRMSNP